MKAGGCLSGAVRYEPASRCSPACQKASGGGHIQAMAMPQPAPAGGGPATPEAKVQERAGLDFNCALSAPRGQQLPLWWYGRRRGGRVHTSI